MAVAAGLAALAIAALAMLRPAAGLAADPVDVAGWQAGDACPRVLVLGARGSGQEDGHGGYASDSPTLGLGTEVDGFARHLAGILAAEGITVAAQPVEYPAVPTDEAVFGEPDYFDSVEAGKLSVRVQLALVRQECGALTRVVVAGYSQGAAVARRGVAFAQEEDRASVAALVLLADPNYDPDSGGYHLGGAAPDRHGLLGAEPPAEWIEGRTVNVCLELDAFCQSELSSTGFLVHGSGYDDPAVQALTALQVAPLARSAAGTTCLGAAATIVGTPGDDVLLGADGDDVIVGGGGDDQIRSEEGNDLICPGPADGDPPDEGHDDVQTGAGDDYVVASAGPATIATGAGEDFVEGGGGADAVTGGDDDDYLDGGAGPDTLGGEAGDDYLDGGERDDALRADAGIDYLAAGPGADRLEAGVTAGDGEGAPGDGELGGDYYEGGEGDDLLHGGPGEEYLDGGPGSDQLLGSGGEDYLDGGEDGDDLSGGGGLDFFQAGAGDDHLVAVDREADSAFECSAGSDELIADAGEDDAAPRSECELASARNLSDTSGDGLVRVAVLGDSYISGVGAVDPGEPYDTGTDTPGNRCRRTSHSWGPQLAASLGAVGDDLLFAACNGATSADVVSRGQEAHSDFGVHGSLPQVTVLRDWGNVAPADIVVLSIGGNDVGFADLVADCLMGPCLWFAEDRLQSAAFAERYRLADTYRTVLAAARERNPNAELWVATYPNPLAGEVCAGVGYLPGVGRVNGYGIDVAEQTFLRDTFLPTLNESIEWAATAAGARPLDLEDAAAGHELCSDDPYFNGVSPAFQGDGPWVVSARTAHPNKAGHAHFADLLWNANRLGLGAGAPEPAGGSGPLPALSGSLQLGPDPIALQDTAPPDVLFRPGDEVHLEVSGAPPGSYRLVVRSLPVVVAEPTVPASGETEAAFRVPAWLAPQSHWLTLENEGGEPLLSAILQVGAAPGCELAAEDSDRDGDRLPDRCDSEPLDGPDADFDLDGTGNADDDCPLVANQDQADADADGLGDACDPSQGGDPTRGYRLIESAPDHPPVEEPGPIAEPTPEPGPEPGPGPGPGPQPASGLPAGAPPPAPAGSTRRSKCKRVKRKHRGTHRRQHRARPGKRKTSRCRGRNPKHPRHPKHPKHHARHTPR